jgi:hypothetical protein
MLTTVDQISDRISERIRELQLEIIPINAKLGQRVQGPLWEMYWQLKLPHDELVDLLSEIVGRELTDLKKPEKWDKM